MSDALSYAERALAWVVRQHFRIPPAAFWVLAVVGAVLAPFLSLGPAFVSVAVALVGVFGVLRWRWHRRRTLLVVLAQPVTVDPADRLANRAQQLVMEALAARLTPAETALVHPIPARVGPTEVRLADGIRRRLGARMVVVGRIDRRADGGWSLFSGLVQAPDTEVIHLDWHTRERIPARAPWEAWLDRLTPTRDVQDVQEPLLMSGEIEAIVRGFVGYIASWANDLERAEKELRAAIAASGDSETAAIDDLRCQLAKVLMRSDRRDEARDVLRRRAQGQAPSPELLRTFARLLGAQPGDFEADFIEDSFEGRSEALQALRAAAAVRADPRRPMSLYNLSALLSDEDEDESAEGKDALAEAMAASRYYRRAWYTRRTRGANHWHAAQRAKAEGDMDRAAAEFEQAARWYSAAIRARPHFRLWHRDSTTMTIRPIARFPASPILHANGEDAHVAAGHRLRGRWHRWRAERGRVKRIRKGTRFFDKERWEGAYANFDFAVIGRRADLGEAFASVMRAFSLQQLGETEAASSAFAQADERYPDLALPIRLAIHKKYRTRLPHGVPGDGPMDDDAVRAELERRGYTQ